MEFKVLKLTANCNLLLEPINAGTFKNGTDDPKRFWIENKPVFFNGTKVGTILEPIGSVSNPLFIAAIDRPADGSWLVGKTLADAKR